MIRDVESAMLNPSEAKIEALAPIGLVARPSGGESPIILDDVAKHPDRSHVAASAATYVENQRNQQRWILRMASTMEPDVELLMTWFHDDPITALGGFTAAELVAKGSYVEVMDFLARVARD